MFSQRVEFITASKVVEIAVMIITSGKYGVVISSCIFFTYAITDWRTP